MKQVTWGKSFSGEDIKIFPFSNPRSLEGALAWEDDEIGTKEAKAKHYESGKKWTKYMKP